jgi:hypothetical protein
MVYNQFPPPQSNNDWEEMRSLTGWQEAGGTVGTSMHRAQFLSHFLDLSVIVEKSH